MMMYVSEYLGKVFVIPLIIKNIYYKYLPIENFRTSKLHAFVTRFFFFFLLIEVQSSRFILFIFFVQ